MDFDIKGIHHEVIQPWDEALIRTRKILTRFVESKQTNTESATDKLISFFTLGSQTTMEMLAGVGAS